MLKIFLVEDEFVVREGIKKIDWAGHGYEFCGEASDGELALPQIGKIHPDIVITDIKMPFMDGIELSRHIRKDYPDIEIVILSGYEEFGYAKEAIALGVARYLTKPIGALELLDELDHLRETIEMRKKEKEISDRYMEDVEEEALNSRKQFFQDLVTGGKSVSELLETAASFNIDLKASCYRIVLSILTHKEKNQDEYSESMIKLYNRLHEWAGRKDFVLFDRELEGKAILFMADSEEELDKLVKKSSQEFFDIISEFDHVRFYGGAGKAVCRLSEIPISFDTARAAIAHRFFDTENRIVFADEMKFNMSTSDEDIDIQSIDTKSLDRSKLNDFLKLGDAAEIEFFLEEFFANLGESAIKSSMFRQYIAMDSYFAVTDFVSGLGLDKTQIETIDPTLSVASSVEGVKDYCARIIESAIGMRNSVSHNKYKDVVDSAISYIEENYTNEDLSLNMLAEHVRFSPNHLSMIFSQQTGMTFSKFLIEFRINKAKEALRCTAKKSSEIAIEIGYKDPHYFSYMFKKITGMTPTQYREGDDKVEE